MSQARAPLVAAIVGALSRRGHRGWAGPGRGLVVWLPGRRARRRDEPAV